MNPFIAISSENGPLRRLGPCRSDRRAAGDRLSPALARLSDP
jgi:hypothetical protein